MGLKPPFKIGELAQRSARSVHTIRWYESQGLLPKVERDGGGRRLYTQWHADWLAFLGRLRTTGMSIKSMKQYAQLISLGDTGLPGQESLLYDHRASVEAQMQELEVARKMIDRKLAYYRRIRDARTPTP